MPPVRTDAVVYAASLTAVELAGAIYLPVRLARRSDLGYPHLWGANFLVFGTCQVLTIAGIGYTYAAGIQTLYHDTEGLRTFLGYDPTHAQHIRMHVVNWMVVMPTVATWIIGAPIVYFMRRSYTRRDKSL